MTTIQLGASPGPMIVHLVKGCDFVTGFDSEDGDWPAGCVITLEFNDSASTVFTATVDGEAVDWNEDKADVDALIARGTTKAQVRYVDGSTDLVWFKGPISTETD